MDSTAIRDSIQRAEFAKDKNQLVKDLGIQPSNNLSPPGSATPQLTTVPAAPSGQLNLVDASPVIAAHVDVRVGEDSHIGATPVDSLGRPIEGVKCSFSSSNTSVATVNPTTGVTKAVGKGDADIIETCNGRSASVRVSVRDRLVTLSISQLGDGRGIVTATSGGRDFRLGSYELGSIVIITASPLQMNGSIYNSTFVGWGGDCKGYNESLTCELSMTKSMSVVATFKLVGR